MYLPGHFEQHDPAALAALMREHLRRKAETVLASVPEAAPDA